MIKYYVSVMEHREKTVCIEARTHENAEHIARRMYECGEIELTKDDIDPVASKVKAWMKCPADEESINDSYWEDEVDRIYKEG